VKVVIVGSGIAGLGAAWELGNRGVTDITILDRYPLATRASWAGGGILSPICPWDYPQTVQRLFLQSRRQYDAFFAQVQEESGIDPEYQRCGLRIRGTNLKKAEDWCRQHDVACQIEAENQICLPDFAQVRNPRLLKGLIKALRRRGVVLESGVTVQPPEPDAIVHGISDGARWWPADVVIAATGAWTARWLGEASRPTPVKGQMVLFASQAKASAPIDIDMAQDIYLVTRRDGHILAGSTLEPNTWDQLPDAEAIAQLTARARKLNPTLNQVPVVAAWAGLRPYQPNGIPLIGPHPNMPGLHFHCGHYRNGFNLNPASAQQLVDGILDKTPADNPCD